MKKHLQRLQTLMKISAQDRAILTVRAGFIAIVSLMVVVGTAGTQRLYTLYREMTTIVEVNNKKVELAYIMQDAIRQRRTLLNYMYAINDAFERDEKLLQYFPLAGVYRNSRDKLLTMSMTSTESDLYKKLSVAARIAQPKSDYVAELLSDNAEQEDIKAALHEQADERQAVLDLLDQLVDLQKQYAEQTLARTREEYDLTLTIVLSLGVFAILIAVLIANYVSRYVNSENKQLLKKNQELNNATKNKSDFLARMSHELRTPLNVIFGYSEIAEEEAHKLNLQRTVDDIHKIQDAGKDLLALIDGIFDISKIVAGDTEIRYQKVDLDSFVSSVITTIKPIANKNNNKITVSMDETLVSVTTDSMKLKQTLYNLLSNACKFTTDGNIHVSVQNLGGSKERWFKISVKDDGIGISKTQQDKLFADYTQADSSIPHHYGGTGLGLSISQKICELLGGTLTVSSEVAKGSEFTILLPQNSSLISSHTEYNKTRAA